MNTGRTYFKKGHGRIRTEESYIEVRKFLEDKI